MSDSYSVPQAVRKEAQRGLDLRKEHGRGGLTTQEAGKHGIGSGVQRAVDLIEGTVSYATVKRMLAFFNRHKAFKEHHTTNPPSNSLISWLLWGGDAGYRWAQRIVKDVEGVEKGTFRALVLGITDDAEDDMDEQVTSFSDLIVKAQGLPPPAKDDDDDDDEETWDAVYVPQIIFPTTIRTSVKKALQDRRKLKLKGDSDARRYGLALLRGHHEALDIDAISQILDGMGSGDPTAELDARLVGGVTMFEAICRAQPAVPEKYLEGLTGAAREKRKRQIQARIRGKHSYAALEGDADTPTKPSRYTKTKLAAAIRDEVKGTGKGEFLRAAAKVGKAPRKILEQVYDRGLKAWATSGHRVGATAQQWGIARVYSFLTGGKTTKTADKDLYQQWKSE